MAEWLRENIFITQLGNTAMTNAAVGKSKILITKVTTSSETFKGDYPTTATDLTKKVQDFASITWRKVSNNSSAYLLQMQLSNKQGLNYPNPPSSSYKLCQIGVFAKEVDVVTSEEGSEFLLLYAQPSNNTEDTVTFDTDTEVLMTYAIQLNLYSEVGESIEITTSMESVGMASEKYVLDNIAVFQNYPNFTGEVGLKQSSWFSADLDGNIISYRKQYFSPVAGEELTLYQLSGASAITFNLTIPATGKYTIYVMGTNTPSITVSGESSVTLSSGYSENAPFTEDGTKVMGFYGDFLVGDYQITISGFGVFTTLCIVDGEANEDLYTPSFRRAIPAFEVGTSAGGDLITNTFTLSSTFDNEFKILFPMYSMGDTYALQASFEEFKQEMSSKQHVDILYRDEELTEENVLYFIVDEDKPTITDNTNTFLYDNASFVEDLSDVTEENWFKIVGEGGDENVKPENVQPYNGILKVLNEGETDESADFINEIVDERS